MEFSFGKIFKLWSRDILPSSYLSVRVFGPLKIIEEQNHQNPRKLKLMLTQALHPFSTEDERSSCHLTGKKARSYLEVESELIACT